MVKSSLFKKLQSTPLYPLLFAAYPALALLQSNIDKVGLSMLWRPLLGSVVLGGLVFWVVWLFLRQAHKAALLTTLWLALFFSYGHVYMAVEKEYPGATYTRWLTAVWVVLFSLALVWVVFSRFRFASSTLALNVAALALLIMAGWRITPDVHAHSVHALAVEDAPIQTDLVLPEKPPDVYYFLLDSYGRSDLLEQAYHFDNSEFLAGLEQRGFFVAGCSQSNYVRTELSMASALNMQYLQALSDKWTPDTTARRLLWNSIKHSAVRYNFENLGYETVTADTGFDWLNIPDSDHFLSPLPVTSSQVSQFETLLLQTTFARYVENWGWLDPDALKGAGSRDRFRTVFNNIDDIARMPQPTFAYLHLISPHPPFVFDPSGKPTYPPDFWNENRQYPWDLYEKGYVNQLPFLNKNILQAIDTIMAESDVPPVIIVQSDHGPWLQSNNKRMWNLTAIYFPGHKDRLYAGLSPVNIFRLVFNTYFGGKYDMLKDVSYFSPVPQIYDFSRVSNSCGNNRLETRPPKKALDP